MKKIIFYAIITILFFTINSVEGKSICPEDTDWDGQNCIYHENGKPIDFTDYFGNTATKSNDIVQEIQTEIVITAPKHEILRDLMIIKPEIIEIQNQTGKALEQKIMNDKQGPTNLDRSNYDFSKVLKWTTKNAVSKFNKIVFGKQIQNSDFGENHQHQIEYTKRYERYEDPVLQYNIIQENQRAQKIFLINWGNFTND